MTIPPYPSTVRKVSDGEPVQASIANKAPTDLDQRTAHLKARLDAAQLGQILLLTDQVLDASVLVGNIVYRDTVGGAFKPALAGLRDLPDSMTGVIELDPKSYSWGVVIDKTTSTLGNVLLAGILPADVDLANLIEDTPGPSGYDPGPYFLSNTTAGKATKRPAISGLYQFFLSDDGTAFVLPSPHGILEDHIHRVVLLLAEPAGTANTPADVDDTHTIPSPDPTAEGWLPIAGESGTVDDATPTATEFITDLSSAVDEYYTGQYLIFTSGALTGEKAQITAYDGATKTVTLAPGLSGAPADTDAFDLEHFSGYPVGTKFGYNIAKDTLLSEIWPPIPVEGSFLQKNGATMATADVIIDTSGIWWMRDDYGNAPWPVDINDISPEQEVELRLFLTEFVTKTDKTVVTDFGLVDGEQSLQLERPDGTPLADDEPHTGRIRIGLNFNLISGADDTTGPLVVKDFTGTTFERGPVVEKVQAGPSGRVAVASSLPNGQGTVEIDLVSEPSTPEETNNLRVVQAPQSDPDNVVQVLAGTFRYREGHQVFEAPSAVLSGPFAGVTLAGKERYDLVVFDIEQFLLAGTYIEIVQGTEAAAGSLDPYEDAPWDDVDLNKIPLAIVKIDEVTGNVDVVTADIINVKTLNKQLQIADSASDLRQDGLDSSGAPDVNGSPVEDGATRKLALAQHSHKSNVGSAVPVPDGDGDAGSSAVYARDDHEHQRNVDAVDPEPPGTASPGTADTYARRDHVHPSGVPANPIVYGITSDTDTFRVLEAEIASEDLSTIIQVTRASPLDLVFTPAATNQPGGPVYTTDGAPEALRVDRWHAIYLLKHSTLGTAVIASLVYDKFDNVRPSDFAAETISAGVPPFPTSAWAGAKYKRIGSAYLRGDSTIRAFEQVNGTVKALEELVTLLTGTNTGTKGNLTFDARLGCPPGATAVRLFLKGHLDHEIRLFRASYDPGTPSDTLAVAGIFAARGELISGGVGALGPVDVAQGTNRIYSDFALWHFLGGAAGTTEVVGFVHLDDPEQREFVLRLEPAFLDTLAAVGYGIFYRSMYEDPSIGLPNPIL